MATVKEHLISSGHVLTRSAVGSIQAHRQGASGYSCYGNAIIMLLGGTVTLYSVGFAIRTIQSDPFDGTYSAYLDWQAPGSYQSHGHSLIEGSIYLGNEFLYDPPFTSPSFDESISIDISVSGTFELWCRYGYAAGTQQDAIWKGYQVDEYDPYGPTPDGFEYYYVLPEGNDLSVSFTIEGITKAYDIEWSQALSDSLRYGIGPGACSIYSYTKVGSVPGDPVEYPYPVGTFKTVGVITYGGIDGSFSGIEAEATSGGEVVSQATLDGTTATVQSRGDSLAFSYALWKAAYTCHANGYVKHEDGTPVAGVALENACGATDTTDETGYAALSHDHAGRFIFGYGTEPLYDVCDVCGGADDAEYSSHYSADITNLLTKEEPEFPWCGNLPDNDDWDGYRDKRTELEAPVFSWENMLKVLVAASREVIAFDAVTGWNVTAGAANLSIVGGKLVVEVTSAPCTISKDYSAGDTWAGGRYAEIAYTSGDSEDITLGVAGRTYTINPADNEIDVLAVADSVSSGTMQTAFPPVDALNPGGVTPSWDWGIHNPGTVAFSGLRDGKTYTFESVTIVKRPDAEGGFVKVLMSDGAFVGSVMGDSRQGDPYSLFFYIESDAEELPHYLGRIGLVIVDGVVGAEIFGMKHLQMPGEPDYWSHQKLQLSDSLVMYPADGSVSLVVQAAESGQEDWQNGDVEAVFLEAGTYNNLTGTDYALLDFQVRTRWISVPFDKSFPLEIDFIKYLRGRGYVRALNYDGTPASGKPVCIETRLLSGGEVIDTVDGFNTDSNGHSLLPSLPQPQIDRGIITSKISSTIYAVSGLSRDYTGHTVFFYGAIDIEPQQRTIVNHAAGQITLDSAPDDDPAEDQPVFVQLEYLHTIFVGGDEGGEFAFRNRGCSLMTLKEAMVIHGPLYNPLDPTFQPCFVPSATNSPEYI